MLILATNEHKQKTENKLKEELLVFPDENSHSIGRLIELFNHAQKEILISIFRIKDELIREAIKMASNRGVKVKIILANYRKSKNFFYDELYKEAFTNLRKNKETAKDLQELDCVRVVLANENDFYAYHPKLIVIDKTNALIGTANLTKNGFENERNIFLVTNDETIVNESIDLFNRDFNNQPIDYSSFKKLAVSPGNYYQQLYDLIASARKEICIYQTTLAYRPIRMLLVNLARKGVRVRILTSKRVSQNSVNLKDEARTGKLKLKNEPNIEYKYINEPFYIHAKVVIVDAKVCFIGSSLFWEEGFFQSREIGVISNNPKTVHLLMQTFEKDFSIAVDEYSGNINIS